MNRPPLHGNIRCRLGYMVQRDLELIIVFAGIDSFATTVTTINTSTLIVLITTKGGLGGSS